MYDFKNPYNDTKGFRWETVDPNWQNWNNEEFLEGIEHPNALWGFRNDFNYLNACDMCVLVLPCGRSAHLEAGFCVGMGKQLHIILDNKSEPELMYRMAYRIHSNLNELLEFLDSYAK
jgi:hypothetical protein